MGVSFGVSAISTTALIVSVAFPPAAVIAGPIALGGGVVASITGTLADDKTRTTLKDTYHMVKGKYDIFMGKIDSLITNKPKVAAQ